MYLRHVILKSRSIYTRLTHSTLPCLLKPFHSPPPLSRPDTNTDTDTAFSPSPFLSPSPSHDPAMTEFLHRFVHSMRSKLTDAYPETSAPTINSMLTLVVHKLIKQMGSTFTPSHAPIDDVDDIGNEDLNNTMWEVSNAVYAEMEREKKKAKLGMYLQSEEVKTLVRFASEVGVRGDMLREFRFKFARETMEDAEFYDQLKEIKDRNDRQRDGVGVGVGDGAGANVEGYSVEDVGNGEDDLQEVLPKRHGKISYKLYGLDLSGETWREVAEKVHEAEEVMWPAEAKAITGKCRQVTEKIIGIGMDADDGYVSDLFKEWVELLQPSRVDWVALLENVKARDYSVYLKIAERILDEPTFQADIRDYSLLIDAHAKENRTEDVERLLKKMSKKGLPQDALILTSLVHMYCKANKPDHAKEAYEALKSLGFKADIKMYSALIRAYINAGQLKSADGLMTEMEKRQITPSEELYMSLLQAFALLGDMTKAQRIVATMQLAGFQPTAETCNLLIQASAKSGNAIEAKTHFDYMIKLGYKPDDKTISMIISAYENKNELDKALSLLLQLEKDGFEPGISTYCVLVDWMGKLQLINEAEHFLAKIAQLGEAPPFKVHVSLCDMYARAGVEKKALQTLVVLEGKKDLLGHEDFERVIQGLLKGGFLSDAKRIQKLMEGQGFITSESTMISFMNEESLRGIRRK